ncbi:hypothetical protein QI30_08485 [Kurthia sp. 3B1D]|uniref:Uncharacterized protein n=1 Tax=Candidatus Kurthia intestinigallinarum TaxID=1562256 RepID=A0A433RUK2_9BACL|nr:hypothetical protein [Kurthia sp. 3B1D]RUS56953.1 hypothetical protein QI30_08485 [Kurthia sp. 3B1D]
MVQQFNSQTPVVRLPIHLEDHLVQNNKKSWLLLPTKMYKILLPTQQQRTLNLFQDTVLKLLRSGYKSPEKLAEMLHLGIDLVKYVLGELIEKNLIDAKYVVTKSGIEYFSSQSTKREFKIGYIFYDLLTNQFWNQVLLEEDLSYVDADLDKKPASIELGTIDKPKTQRVLLMQAKSVNERTVTPEDIYRTVNASIERIENVQGLKNRYRKISLDRTMKSLEDIKLISSGDEVYLPTFMYLPVNLKQNSQWQVLHPFGATNSTELLDALQRIRHQYDSLNNKIDELLKTALDTVKPSIEEQDKEIYKYVLSVFGDKIEKKHDVLQSTIHLVRSFKKVKQLLHEKNRGAIFEDLQTEFSAFAVHTIELFEMAFYTIQKSFKNQEKRINEENKEVNIKHYTKKDARQNLKTLHTLAIKNDFEVNASPDVYAQLLKMRAGEITHGYGNRNLKGLLAISLIQGSEKTNYPLRYLAKKFPTFLDFLQDLLILRNLSAHLTEDTFETNVADDIFSKTMYAISVLFNTLFNRDLVEEYGDFDEASLMTDRKLRLLSKQHIHHLFDASLEEQPVIEKLLRDMHYFKDNHPYHFAMKAVSVIEQILNQLLQDFSYNDIPEMPGNALEVLEAIEPYMISQGFTWNVSELPETFINFNFKKITLELLSLKKSVPNAKLYALFLLMPLQPQEKWHTIASKLPTMFEEMIMLIDLRKHGHVIIEQQEMEKIEAFIIQLVKVTLPHLQN